jgi:hypothetical protein
VKFWILWAVDAIAAAVVVGFFFVGLADGSVSSFNAGLWTVILLSLAAILGGSLALRRAGQIVLAVVLLLVLAMPAILYGVFLLLFIIIQPDWK